MAGKKIQLRFEWKINKKRSADLCARDLMAGRKRIGKVDASHIDDMEVGNDVGIEFSDRYGK